MPKAIARAPAKVVRFASRLTRRATVPAPARAPRNVPLSAVSRLPAFRATLAYRLSTVRRPA
jgi:hypothetical protein